MDNNFDRCLAFVLKEEGGNDDDPNDHGGRTSRGITQREWDKFRLTNPDRPVDVWKAPDNDIRTIYHASYWLPHCSNLPSGLDLCFFDFGVNAGQHQAIKTLQKCLGIPSDGGWGPQTESLVSSIKDVASAINAYSVGREGFYKGLAQYPRYGRGWTSRNEACRKEALSMVGVTVPSPQANPVDVKKNKTAGPATVIVGTAATTAAASQYHSPLIFLGVIAAVLVVGIVVHYLINRKVN